MISSREAAHILARARSTLVLLAAETLERLKRLQDRSGPRIVFKTKDDALITRPHHRTENARLWR